MQLSVCIRLWPEIAHEGAQTRLGWTVSIAIADHMFVCMCVCLYIISRLASRHYRPHQRKGEVSGGGLGGGGGGGDIVPAAKNFSLKLSSFFLVYLVYLVHSFQVCNCQVQFAVS